jgi:hypothetical protein
MDIDELRIKLIEKATFVCWPTWSGGNAVQRIISAHQEDYWWHPYFNLWNYDEKITCPLQYPETQDYQETLNGNFYTTAHIPSVFELLGRVKGYKVGSEFTWKTKKEINEDIKNKLQQNPPEAMKDFFNKVILEKKSFTWSNTHTPAKRLLDVHTNINLIVNCVIKTDENIVTNRLSDNFLKKAVYKEQKELFNKENSYEDSRVLNLDIENLFGEDYLLYEQEFEKLSNFLNFSYPRKKAVRAYILYYNERKKIYNHIEKQNI